MSMEKKTKNQTSQDSSINRVIYTWPCKTPIPETIGKDNLMKVNILHCHENKIRQKDA